MKKLSKFEIESLVDVVMSKLDEIESEKLEKEYGERIKEWNEELDRLKKEYKVYENKFLNRLNEIRENLNGKFNSNGWDDSKLISINKGNLVSWNLRNKINSEIVISNLKEEGVENLIENLVNKFKN
jgi:hypothetical protein